MNRFLVGLTIGIHLICLGLIWLSCYPGRIAECWGYLIVVMILLLVFFKTYPVAILLLGILAVGAIIWWRRRRKQQLVSQIYTHRYFQAFGIITNRLLLITIIAISAHLPQKIVFAASAPIFETNTAKLEKICNQKQMGFYRISECYQDKQGGWYIKTSESFFQSYGFAYHPNPQFTWGQPKQSVRYNPLIGEWKSFEESHDWN